MDEKMLPIIDLIYTVIVITGTVCHDEDDKIGPRRWFVFHFCYSNHRLGCCRTPIDVDATEDAEGDRDVWWIGDAAVYSVSRCDFGEPFAARFTVPQIIDDDLFR